MGDRVPGTRGIRPKVEAAIASLLSDKMRAQALLAATDAIVWTIDPERGFIEEQPSWQSYTGQSWEEARGHGWISAVHPDDRQPLAARWNTAVREGEQYSAAPRIWHAESRQYRHCVVRANAILGPDGQVFEWVGAVTDVHDRPLSLPELHRLNEVLKQQLEERHQVLERLFSVSLDIMVMLAADGRILTVSPSFEAVTGFTVQQAVGEVFARFLHPQDVERTWAAVDRVATGQHNAIDFETRLVRVDGQVRLVSWRAVGSSAEARLYAVGRDITTQREEQERAVRAQRMEIMGQLTGGIAHDFNNILSAIGTYLDVARKVGAQDPERLLRIVESALHSTRKGASLVAQLLTFAKRRALAQEPVDMNELVEGMREMIATSVGGAVVVALELAAGLPRAMANRTQVEAILLNLCINARDAMPGGGSLTLATSVHHITDDPDTRIDDLPKGRYARLSVDDTGTGMDKDTLARCVEPFFTTKGDAKGTGLGLSQAYTVAQQLGGNLRIRSEPGAGTTVELLLPCAANVNGDGQLRPAPPLRKATVVLVDDDPDVLASVSQLLDAHGYEVIPCSGAQEALAIVLASRPFDVLLTDHSMPAVDGVQLIHDAQRLRPKLVGLVMSGGPDLSKLQRELPQVTVLRKPVAPHRLVQAVESCVAAHRANTGQMGDRGPRDREPPSDTPAP